jgi:hypothetical protein
MMAKLVRAAGLAALAAALLFASPARTWAENGSVQITVTKAAFIVGLGGGSGTLFYKGRFFPLSVGGISVLSIGVASTRLTGRAYNLHSAADIEGAYAAISGGLAFGAGRKVARLRNAKGVVLDLHGRQLGVEASLSLSALSIRLK